MCRRACRPWPRQGVGCAMLRCGMPPADTCLLGQRLLPFCRMVMLFHHHLLARVCARTHACARPSPLPCGRPLCTPLSSAGSGCRQPPHPCRADPACSGCGPDSGEALLAPLGGAVCGPSCWDRHICCVCGVLPGAQAAAWRPTPLRRCTTGMLCSWWSTLGEAAGAAGVPPAVGIEECPIGFACSRFPCRQDGGQHRCPCCCCYCHPCHMAVAQIEAGPHPCLALSSHTWLGGLPLPLCRSMGESSALLKRRPELPRSVALATAAAYSGLFAEQDGSIPGGC